MKKLCKAILLGGGCILIVLAIVLFSKKTIESSTFIKKNNNIETLKEQIKSGDFSNLKETDNIRIEEIKRVYANKKNDEGIEWIEGDLNGDGLNELIWQEEKSYNEGMKRIVGIFTFQTDEPVCTIWDINDSTEFLFMSDTGNIIYYTQYYGTYYFNGFDCYKFDSDWNKELFYGLHIYNVYDISEVDVQWWHEEHPDMTNEGIYYKRYILKSSLKYEENLEEKEFLKGFEEMCGFSFDYMKFEEY